MPRSGIAGFSCNNMSNFLRNRQTGFQNNCTSLQSCQRWRVPLSSHPCQHPLSPAFLVLAILTDVRWNLRVVLICISLIPYGFEHFFKCFSAIQDSSVVNSQFSSIAHFLIVLFGFWVVSFLSSLYILDIIPLLDVGLVKIFSQTVGCLIDYVLCLTEAFQFHKVPFYNYWS